MKDKGKAEEKRNTEVMEDAGGVIAATMGAKTTIRARVLASDGSVIEDLGVIVGRRTKAEGDKCRAALKRLAAAYRGVKHGS